MSGRDDPRTTTEARPARNAEQRRAANALQAVQRLPGDDELRKRYRAYADRLGPVILMNGLGQALASELAAARTPPRKPDAQAHHCLYQNMTEWLCGGGGVYAPGNLLDAIVGGSEALYLRAQTEALAWLVWHKKFCRAYLPASEEVG